MSETNEPHDAEIVITENVDLTTFYQQDKAVIDTQIATAKQYPRNVKRSTDNAVAVVTLDQKTAETCVYTVPRGGKAIQGPSVHVAKVIAQFWGNMRIQAKVISVDAKTLTSQAMAFDLENNIAIQVEVKRSIMTKTGRMNDDMIVVTGNAANSIALRNAILSVIPKQVVDKVYNAAKAMITGDVSDKVKLIARRKQIFDGLQDTYELTEAEILKVLGRAAIDHVTADDLVVLVGIGTSIKDGDTTVEMAFKNAKSAKQNEVTKEELQDLYNSKKDSVSEDDQIHIERIIENSESESYRKTFESLKKIKDARP